MFFFSQDKSRWQQLANDPSTSPALREAILQTLMKYKIDVFKWATNIDCISRWDHISSDSFIATGGLAQIIQTYHRWEMPLRLPDWFLAGFPDVWLWMVKNNDFVSAELEKVPKSQIMDSRENMKPEGWNMIIDLYKKKTGYSLELYELHRYR